MTLLAVSYTHLDVYKRQVEESTGNIRVQMKTEIEQLIKIQLCALKQIAEQAVLII